MSTPLLLLVALALDAALGEPRWLWDRVPHPAVLIGRVIGWADNAWNRGAQRRAKGVALVILLVAGSIALGGVLAALPFGPVWEVLIAAILLAQKSLADHVRAVALALRTGLPEGRRAVAMIVGRDTETMDPPAVARAAIESAAENLSDGVVAPAVWFLLGGLPGILAYKAVNTADSMIGYRTPRHGEFGWAAARLDDVLNWVPARLTAALIALAHGRRPWTAPVRADAALHRSPNAGWPEAAMARTLDVALSGPRSYDGALRDFPWVHPEGDRAPGPERIDAAVTALWRTWALLAVTAAGLALVWPG
ncbi:cobalamin biosynthesis protein [Rhodobacteraceae bacterium CCMM004]|nr:cobalamin biosynthesis protein [Rhodobacteraceae bacterium CCMM004]